MRSPTGDLDRWAWLTDPSVSYLGGDTRIIVTLLSLDWDWDLDFGTNTDRDIRWLPFTDRTYPQEFHHALWSCFTGFVNNTEWNILVPNSLYALKYYLLLYALSSGTNRGNIPLFVVWDIRLRVALGCKDSEISSLSLTIWNTKHFCSYIFGWCKYLRGMESILEVSLSLDRRLFPDWNLEYRYSRISFVDPTFSIAPHQSGNIIYVWNAF